MHAMWAQYLVLWSTVGLLVCPQTDRGVINLSIVQLLFFLWEKVLKSQAGSWMCVTVFLTHITCGCSRRQFCCGGFPAAWWSPAVLITAI